MDKQAVAKQMIDYYKWCAYHDIEIFGDFVKCLGHQCRKELVADAVNSGNLVRIIEGMKVVGK